MIDAAEHAAPRFNMAAYSIGRAAAARGGEPALIVVDDAEAARPAEMWTFAAARGRGVAHRRRSARRLGLEPGARILIRLENTSAYALLFFGAIAGGFVPLPTSAQLTEPEVRFFWRTAARKRSPSEASSVSERLPQACACSRPMRSRA